MNHASVLSQFERLLPLAVTWATEEERKILREGAPLSEKEISDARAIGVQSPHRVRPLQIETIPRPSHPELNGACDAIDFLTPATRGLTLGYGIFIRWDCWRDRLLVVHELAHVAQYERFGGILPFLRKYLFECLTMEYAASPLELEQLRPPRVFATSELSFPFRVDRITSACSNLFIVGAGGKKMSRAAG